MNENLELTMPKKKKKALFFSLDCLNWSEARSISFNINYGYADALVANGIECTVVPIFGDIPAESRTSWNSYVREWFKGESFDLAFFILPHSKFTPDYWEWIASVAPIRIGIIMESMHYDQMFLESIPLLKNRAELIKSQMRYCTHVLTGDERDVAEINENKYSIAQWVTSMVSMRHVLEKPLEPIYNKAAFLGTPYYHRRNYLEDQNIAKFLVKPEAPENATLLPKQFNQLNQKMISYLQEDGPKDINVMFSFVTAQRDTRKLIDDIWMAELGKWSASVNLPSLYNGYTSRVVESMAAGRPVISWKIPNSPRHDGLFKDGEDILLFSPNDPSQLLSHLNRVVRDRDFTNQIAKNALEKVRNFHTLEKGLERVLKSILL